MTSFFQGASQIDARGHFTAIGPTLKQYNIQHAGFTNAAEEDTLLASLKPVESSYVHPCMSGTRQWMIEKIHRWVGDHQAPNILWLSGSPGAGKSTIASTLVSTLQETGRLGSSFFFKRDDTALSDPAACWRTIAFDLARWDSVIAKRMIDNMKGRKLDPRRADIELHFKYLIEDPLRAIWRSRIEELTGLRHSTQVEELYARYGTAEIDQQLIVDLPVVILDALDECASESSQSAQRQTFLNTITHWSRLPRSFKLVVTSRDTRIPNSLRAVCHRLTLDTGDVASLEAIKDVRVFIEKRFAAIAERNHYLSQTWPGESVINQLTHRAAGLFVWADTMVKFVEQGIPNKRLNSILQDQFHYGEESLDGLYRQVVNLSFKYATDDELEIYKLVVGAVVLAKTPLRRRDLRYFLSRNEEEASITSVLLGLSSVISMGTGDEFIHISHLSFTEFICDPHRCGELFAIHRGTHNRIMALACLHVMRTELRFNICQLETSHVRNVSVPDITSRIKKFISTHLSYSCRFWSAHLRTATIDAETVEAVKEFLHTHLLYWLEVLSLIKEVNIASQVLISVRECIGPYDEDVDAFATDAGKFVSTFGSIISQSAPHIYISALPFAPTGSKISQQFLPLFTATLSFQTGRPADWPTILNVLGGHTMDILSIALSRDGKRIVSGSSDETVRVWDAETGEVVSGPFEGHTGEVSAVAFSPDGQRIVSGSYDEKICVWDTETGGLVLGPFRGHTAGVSSVAFSPDGQHIISGSYDKTICVRDAWTGRMVSGPLEGHDGAVYSVAFSYDSKRIASGSGDETICVWDVETGKVVSGPFEGHNREVHSVSFSHDNKRIVSGSWDKTIRVWDSETGQVVAGPFEGHTREVNCVRFSPDDKHIVSGSSDGIIYVWDAETAEVVSGPFEGHASAVVSVTFSPDGKRIVSGSWDTTICVWDIEMGGLASRPFEGHAKWINSVAFSHDGKHIVSGSSDNTIRVWNSETGGLVSVPFKGHTREVVSVAFSHDGSCVVSGSLDATIRVWDTETGKMISGPFDRHREEVTSVAFSPDGQRIVSGSYGEMICVCDTETGEVVSGPFKGHSGGISAVAFSPDGQRIVSGSYDKTICVWDAETGEVNSGPFKGHTDWVNSVAFSYDGNRIVSGSSDETIRVWNAATGEVVSGPFTGHTHWVNSVDFSHDGKRIVSGSWDKTIRVWDAETGAVVLGPFEGHTKGVVSVAFSPDGQRIVSASYDKTIRVWDAEASKVVTQPVEDLSVEAEHVHQNQIDQKSASPMLADNSKLVDGWILGSNSELLFWVPPSMREGLWWPRNMAVIAKTSTNLDFKSFCHGNSWAQCKRRLVS